jgi:hypothetical protein
MGSAPQESSLRNRLVGILKYVPGGALLFAVVPMLLLGYLGWYYYGAEHLDRALYSVSVDQLMVTPQPNWIKSDVTEEVFRKARLDRISLLDPKANATIAQAFESHSWVKTATRVTKSSGGKVAVDLVYRRPVAMVYCSPQDASAGFYPVDDEAILLPVDDFSPEQVYEYLLIIADGTAPAGDSGMAYGSSLVVDTLKLCRFLEQDRKQLGLQRVYVDEDERMSGSSRLLITLETDDKHLIQWGHVPKAELPGELDATGKLSKMSRWLAQQREAAAPPGKLDLLEGRYATPVSNRGP